MILKKVVAAIKRHKLISRGDLVLIAVSGGPDSVCLLYLLKDLRRELGFKLHIAHLDHMLRKDAGKDAEFVKSLGFKLGIPVTCARINVEGLAKKGSLEEIARQARLDFLFKVAKKNKASKIALAHNLDDQAETVLMRILRGSGLCGLCGILPKRKIAGFTLIRPLIGVRRREIIEFLKKNKIASRQDMTNLEEVYFRNKVRHKLLPLLEKEYSPQIKEFLSNMAQGIGLDYDYLNRAASRHVKGPAGRVSLAGFLRLHPALQRLVLRMHISRLQGSTRRISYRHIQEIEDLIFNRPVNAIVDLPKGISLLKKPKYVLFFHRTL